MLQAMLQALLQALLQAMLGALLKHCPAMPNQNHNQNQSLQENYFLKTHPLLLRSTGSFAYS